MADKAHQPTAAEIQHKAEVNIEAKQLLASALAGDSKAFQRELSTMSPTEQKEVFAEAKRLEKEREKGHEEDRTFPRVEFWDSKQPGQNPTVDVTAQGKKHDKVQTVYDPEHPNGGETLKDKAKVGVGVIGRHIGIGVHN